MKRFYLVTMMALACMAASASHVWDNMEPMKLEVPEMKPELVQVIHQPLDYDLMKDAPEPEPKMDFDFFKQKTNPDVKPYKVMDDLTFVGIPVFAAGWAIKGDKAMFRVNDENNRHKNTQLLTDFKTGIDDYTQYFGPALTLGLKLGGYEGRSDWPRFLASAAMSYGIMAGLVNGIKYTAKEMRPDGSTANSWPSGHTATSFVGATILHKEYGLTRSPWFSVAGYGVATATGVMRVLNNRHWVSDVLSGAGIGIMSTELAYALSDVIFKEKGLLRNDLEGNPDNPSFFAISMGLGLGGKDIDFTIDDLRDKELFDMAGITQQFEGDDENGVDIKFRAATVVDAEGAYFFNKYVGVGGRLRVRAMSAKTFGQFADIADENKNADFELLNGFYQDMGMPDFMNQSKAGGDFVTDMYGLVVSDHLTEFTPSAGLYFNIPLSSRFAIGTKFLVGRSIMQELEIDGHAEGNVKNINYRMTIENGEITEGTASYPFSTGEKYSTDWDYLTLGAKNATSLGTGISLTYRYKSNFSWKVFLDYDMSKKKYTMTYNPLAYMRAGLTPTAYEVMPLIYYDGNQSYAPLLDSVVFEKTKRMNYFTLGASFAINF